MPKRMLIVDDDPSIRDLIKIAFTNDECVVDVAESGEGCISSLRARRPDLILLDVQMPGQDGFQTLRKIRADETLRHLPVVMLTAKRTPSDVACAREMAVADYLAKPINLIQLAHRVQRLLQANGASETWLV